MTEIKPPQEVLAAAQEMEAVKEERELPPVAEAVELDFDNDMRELIRLSDDASGNTDPDPVKAEANVEDWFQTLDRGQKERGQKHYVFGIRHEETGELVSGGAMTVHADSEGRMKGHFRSMATKEEKDSDGKEKYRGRGLQKEINTARLEKAGELKLDYVDTLVKSHKPLAIMVKLKEGFLLDRGNKDYGGFMLTKELKEGPPELEDESVEISFGETEEIYSMIEDVYIGVEMKNNGERDEKHPEKWTLVMKKRVEKEEGSDKEGGGESKGKFTEILPLEGPEGMQELYRFQANVYNDGREEPLSAEKVEERAQAMVTAIQKQIDEGADFRFFGIRKQTDDDSPGELIAGAMIRITEKDGRKHGWLGNLAVRQGFRGKDGDFASKKLTAERMRIAKEECDDLETSTNRYRAIAMRSKLSEGFVITSAAGGKRDVYELKIDFKEPITPKTSESADEEPQELTLDQTDQIEELLKSGDWIGTKVERTGTEPSTVSPAAAKEEIIESGELKNWTMTLERK